MLNDSSYIRLSLELHLFFARIMKEHSFFLEAGFVDRDQEYKKVASQFQESFGEILNEVIVLADRNISNELLSSQEIVTNDTLANEKKTSQLIGLYIDETITQKELNLRSGMTNVTESLLRAVDNINQRTALLVQNLIHFKQDVLDKVLSCQMFTGNYPLLITHIINEAKMYRNIIMKLQNKELATPQYIYEQELFWNNIMKEHAQFIRGLLDPSEEKLISTANQFANEYDRLLQAYRVNNANLTQASLQETISFKAFKEAGEEGILNCKIRSIIIPLLADHVLREANHFIRILKSYQTSTVSYF